MNPITNTSIQELKNLNLADLHLMLELGKNYYSIVLLDEEKNIVFLKSTNQSILECEDFKFTENEFKKVSICFVTTNYVLIPNHLYNEKYRDNYQLFLSDNLDTEVFTHTLTNLNLVILSIVNNEFSIFKSKFFPTVNLLPSCFSYLHYISDNNIEFLENGLFLNFYNQEFDLAFFKNNNLLCLKNEAYLNTDELLYFIILQLNNHEIKPDEIQLFLSGFIDEKSLDYSILKNNFPKLNFINTDNLKINNQIIYPHQVHGYVSVLNLNSCA